MRRAPARGRYPVLAAEAQPGSSRRRCCTRPSRRPRARTRRAHRGRRTFEASFDAPAFSGRVHVTLREVPRPEGIAVGLRGARHAAIRAARRARREACRPALAVAVAGAIIGIRRARSAGRARRAGAAAAPRAPTAARGAPAARHLRAARAFRRRRGAGGDRRLGAVALRDADPARARRAADVLTADAPGRRRAPRRVPGAVGVAKTGAVRTLVARAVFRARAATAVRPAVIGAADGARKIRRAARNAVRRRRLVDIPHVALAASRCGRAHEAAHGGRRRASVVARAATGNDGGRRQRETDGRERRAHRG